MIPLILAPLFLGALAQGQITTTTATILLPDWCVTQTAPTVTVLGQNSLTTYSYGCTVNSAAISSAEARASSALAAGSSAINEAQSRLSEKLASRSNAALPTDVPDSENDKRDVDPSEYNCLAADIGAFDACIPWEITQGASYWAVHYTATGVIGLEQECSFGDGGVASGAATCTASGQLDPSIWSDGEEEHTRTFALDEVEKYWIRDTVVVTAGGPPATTGVFAATATGTAGEAESTGVAVPRSMPTGVVAIMAGAGGILAAALAL